MFLNSVNEVVYEHDREKIATMYINADVLLYNYSHDLSLVTFVKFLICNKISEYFENLSSSASVLFKKKINLLGFNPHSFGWHCAD